MIHSIYGLYDNTLYERHPFKNTGLDPILDLSKIVIGTSSYNNRALIYFDTSVIQDFITETGATNLEYYLNLYTLAAQEVPSSYTIEVSALSAPWDSGIGKYVNNPETTQGSNWYFSSSGATSHSWQPVYYSGYDTASWSSVEGGGYWNYSTTCTQTYNYSSTDIRINVTSIVNSWLGGAIPNYGLIIKKSDVDEQNSTPFNTLKYYSSDAATIYLPKLEIAYNDAIYQPGNLSQPDSTKELLVYIKNLKQAYKETSKVRFHVGVREKYPTVTFATQSNYLQVKQLPTSSLFYSITHADTDETVIPFDTSYTKVSCTSSGNFFDMWMDGLQPERYYKILFRVDRDGSEEYVDNNYIFKVTR